MLPSNSKEKHSFRLLISDVVSAVLAQFAALVFLLGEGDLVEHELGDWVGECGGNWEVGRFGFVAIFVSNEFEFERSTIIKSVREAALCNHGTAFSGANSGLRSHDTVSGFDIETVFSGFAGSDDIAAKNRDNIVIGRGTGGRKGEKGEEKYLKKQNNYFLKRRQWECKTLLP